MSQARTSSDSHITACWTRLADLYTLGLLSRDQRRILADQLEVDDSEVIRHLMVERSDKIVQLAGDLLYESNVMTNIDGGRGNIVLIESPNDSNPCHNEDIIIESQHSVMRFSVSTYQRRCHQDDEVTEDSTEHCRDRLKSLSRQVSITRNGQSGLDSTISRRAYNATRYVERLRSESYICSSEREEQTDDSHKNSDEHVSGDGSDKCLVPTSSSSENFNRKERRITKFESEKNFRLSGKEASQDKKGRVPLQKTPSGRNMQKKNSLRCLPSFEDSTHVVIPIEGGVVDENKTLNNCVSHGDNIAKDRDEELRNNDRKTSGIIKPLTRQFSELWGMCERDRGDTNIADTTNGGKTTCFDYDSGSDNEVVISYEDEMFSVDDRSSASHGSESEYYMHEVSKNVTDELNEKNCNNENENNFAEKMKKMRNRSKSKLSFTIGSFKKMFSPDPPEKKKINHKVANSFVLTNSQLQTVDRMSQITNEGNSRKQADVTSTADLSLHKVSHKDRDCEHTPASKSSDVIITSSPDFDISKTISNETSEATDVKAIRLPKRYLSYYVGGNIKESGKNKIKNGRRPSAKKNLPSHSSIRREITQLQSDFEKKQALKEKEICMDKAYSNQLEVKNSIPSPPATMINPLSIYNSPAVVKPVKELCFGTVEIRFYAYATGSGIPSDGGPSIGLCGVHDESETLLMDIEIFEDFRGGILPEDEDIDEDEEWNDNWRLPREYFVDKGGHLPIKERIDLLAKNGVRRCSIDLSSHLCKLTQSSRLKNSRSRAPRLLIEGQDPDEVSLLLAKWEATQKLEPILLMWMKHWSKSRSKTRFVK